MSYFLFYSDKCPDTPAMVEKLKSLGVNYQAINITDSIPNLKRFLSYRDNHPAFDTIKQHGAVGVPVLTDGQDLFIFSPNEIEDNI